MPLLPAWKTRRDYYYLKPADVIVYRDGGYAVAIDRHGNIISRGTDQYMVLKDSVEEVVYRKSRNNDNIVVNVFVVGLDGTVHTGWENELIPARPLWGTNKRIKLLEMHVLGSNFKQPDDEYGFANFVVINDDYVEEFRLYGYNSEFTIGNVVWIGSAYYSGWNDGSKGTSIMNRIYIDGVKMNVMKCGEGSTRWGGWGIYYGFPSYEKEDGYVVDDIILRNIVARPYIRDNILPEAVLLYPPRTRRIIIDGVDAINGETPDDYGWYSPYYDVIEPYGYVGGNSAEEIIITNSRLFGVIGLYGRYIRVSDSVIGRQIVVAPHVSSVDDSTLTIYAYDDSVATFSNSIILGAVQLVAKYIEKEGTSDVYTVNGSISVKINNCQLAIDWMNNWGVYGSTYNSTYPTVDVRELSIENSEVVQYRGLSWAYLFSNLVGGYFKLVRLKNLRIYGSRNPGLINLTNTQGQGYDLHIEKLVVEDVIIDSVPQYNINIYVDTTKTGNVIIDSFTMKNVLFAAPSSTKFRVENAQVTFNEIIPYNHLHTSSGFITIGAGETIVFGKVTVPSNKALVVTRLYLYDPDSYIKLQIYDVTDATVEKEVGPGTTDDIGYYSYLGGKTYEFRLVNTDTANAHNARAKVIYSIMP